MGKPALIYAAVMFTWYLLINAGVEAFKDTPVLWMIALIVGAIFVIGSGIISAIKDNK